MIFTDQLQRKIDLPQKPLRVISLVPSITELVLDLGLGDRLVGRTKFCIHPAEQVKSVTIIGGTKNLRIEKIKELKPDLILANKEENVESQVMEIAEFCPVYTTDVKGEESALSMIKSLGELLEIETKVLIQEIEENSKRMSSVRKPLGSALYVIWNEPVMAAGTDTFIHQMLAAAGFTNAINQTRYPEVTAELIGELNPDYILLSSEPFPFKEKHVMEFKNRFPNSKIMLVDGELFSWYGSKMVKAYDYFLNTFYQN